MKKVILIISALLLALFVSTSFAAEDVILFDGTFKRDTGAPVVASRTFRATSGLATVELSNGTDMKTRISSARVHINGVEVFGPSEFNKNVGKLEKQVTLNDGENSLTVLLRSGPGGAVRIQIHMPVEVMLAPAAKMVDETTINNLSSISEDGTALVFSAETSQTDSMQQGDVIMSGVTAATPNGLLRKVVSKTKREDGSVEVITEPASLTDAFQELHLTGTIPSAGIAPMSLLQGPVVTPFPSIRYKFPKTSIGLGAGLSCTWDNDYTATFDLDYDIHISWFKLRTFYLALGGSQNLAINGQCEIKARVDWSYEKELVRSPLVIATIPIGPVVLTINFVPSLGMNVSAEGTADLAFGVTANNVVKFGINYTNTQGWSPVSGWDFDVKPYYSIAGEEFNFAVKPYVRLKFPVLIYGAVGPYIDVRGYAKAAATVYPWDCEVGFGASVNCGGEVRILSWQLGELNFELLDLYWPVWYCSQDMAIISGFVTAPGGEPVEGVTVNLGGTNNSTETDTDMNGLYRFTVRRHEVYSLTPVRPGYFFDPPTAMVTVVENDVQQDFTASVPSCIPLKVSPINNAIMSNGCTDRSKTITWNFDWEDCPGATQYHLQVYHPSLATPRIDDQTLTTSSYNYNCPGCFLSENLTGWRWKVRAMVNGQWGLWSNERIFDVEPSNKDCPPTGNVKLIFITSARYTGDLGGLAGADAKCQALAAAAGRPGTFKAWLSDSSTTAGERLTHSTVPYVRTDGTVIAMNWDDLTDGTINVALSVDENGTTIDTGWPYTWTWTTANGSGGTPGWNCRDWTYSGGLPDKGECGFIYETNYKWSVIRSSDGCGESLYLYCIEQ